MAKYGPVPQHAWACAERRRIRRRLRGPLRGGLVLLLALPLAPWPRAQARGASLLT